MQQYILVSNTTTTTTTTNVEYVPNGTYFTQFIYNDEYRRWYEKDLRRRQQDHLNGLQRQNNIAWQPCAHDSCSDCLGTGIKRFGGACIHCLVCNCPKCSPVW